MSGNHDLGHAHRPCILCIYSLSPLTSSSLSSAVSFLSTSQNKIQLVSSPKRSFPSLASAYTTTRIYTEKVFYFPVNFLVIYWSNCRGYPSLEGNIGRWHVQITPRLISGSVSTLALTGAVGLLYIVSPQAINISVDLEAELVRRPTSEPTHSPQSLSED